MRSNFRQYGRQTTAQHVACLFIGKQRIEQGRIVNLKQSSSLPKLNTSCLPLPFHQRIAYILRNLFSSSGFFQDLLNSTSVQSHLDSACNTCLCYTVLGNMLQAEAFSKTIQFDKQSFRDGSQGHHLKIWLYNQSSPWHILDLRWGIVGDQRDTGCQAKSVRIRFTAHIHQPQPTQWP